MKTTKPLDAARAAYDAAATDALDAYTAALGVRAATVEPIN